MAALLFKIEYSEEYKKRINFKSFNDLSNYKKAFKAFGENSSLPESRMITGEGNIVIGKNFRALYNLRLEAINEYFNQKFSPQLIIGDQVNFNSDCHIGCINNVTIGDHVLLASRVYISDHSHGEITKDSVETPPSLRPLISKGPVIIEDNVWIGEGVCILPNVRIGKNSIIGANSVVTKDIPANSIVAGVPAVVLKRL